MFKTTFGSDVFKEKYAQNQYETWADKAKVVVNWVCGDMDGTKNSLMSNEEKHQRAMSCLMTGGGIGADVSLCRPGGRALRRTGGVSSGPLPLLYTLNEIGRNVMQGGSRRSALYGSMDAGHGDVWEFMRAKNWYNYDISGTDFTIAVSKH